MAVATAAAVRKQIKSGDTAPIYLLQGEDDVEKSALGHEFEELVDEGLRAFNVERIHAGDVTTGEKLADCVGRLVDAARTLPMMSSRRVVIVLQAEMLLAPKRESETAARALEELEELLKRPEKATTLVLVAGALDKRSRMFKLLVEAGDARRMRRHRDQGMRSVGWRNRVVAGGAEIEPAGVRLLAERGGTDVRRLRNDVERLLLYALGQKSITVDDVRQVVGPAALQDDWAMTNAIEAGDEASALRQLALMLDAGAPAEKVLGQLGWVVRAKFPTVAPARLRPAVEAVFRTDLDLKRSAGNPRVLLERLVVELCLRRPLASRPVGA